jgi:hypothetical protein
MDLLDILTFQSMAINKMVSQLQIFVTVTQHEQQGMYLGNCHHGWDKITYSSTMCFESIFLILLRVNKWKLR